MSCAQITVWEVVLRRKRTREVGVAWGRDSLASLWRGSGLPGEVLSELRAGGGVRGPRMKRRVETESRGSQCSKAPGQAEGLF